ncbi:MAG: ATP-binding protein [Oscillospiraceae bacterium]|jgi:hypothetical protein|nr:ATP-binding protein [Oscillospiraceae bacterium]
MAIPVLICGRTSTGKSYSMRNYAKFPLRLGIISAQSTKQLPFRADGEPAKVYFSDDYESIKKALYASKAKSIMIDDAGYLITNYFMRNHRGGKGNQVYELYNDIADRFWDLICFIGAGLPEDKIVYFTMHEDTDDNGNIEPKTIGKLLNEKVSIPGMLSIVFRSTIVDGQYVFLTKNTTGRDIAKTPVGMFDTDAIDNDLLIIDNAIRTYYGLHNNNNIGDRT